MEKKVIKMNFQHASRIQQITQAKSQHHVSLINYLPQNRQVTFWRKYLPKNKRLHFKKWTFSNAIYFIDNVQHKLLRRLESHKCFFLLSVKTFITNFAG